MIEATRLEGRSRRGAAEDRGRGNSQPATADSTRLNSVLLLLLLSLSGTLSPSLVSIRCVLVYRHTIQVPLCALRTPTRVYGVVSFHSARRTHRSVMQIRIRATQCYICNVLFYYCCLIRGSHRSVAKRRREASTCDFGHGFLLLLSSD